MLKLLKITLIVAGLALTTIPASAAGGCATVTAEPAMPMVMRGYTQAITGLATNCSTAKSRYTLDVSVKSACGVEWCHRSTRIPLDAGYSTLYSMSCSVPQNTCVGPSVSTTLVKSGSATLAVATTTFDVQ